MEGWIKLHRRTLEWEWFKTPNMYHLFSYLLLSANHQKTTWKGVDIQRGEILTGRNTISADVGISPQSVRTCLLKLISTNEITIKSTNKYSIITIIKYDDYQLNNKDTNQQVNQQTNKRLTTNKKNKEVKKKEKEEEKENFSLSDEEIKNLHNEAEKLLDSLEYKDNAPEGFEKTII